MELELTEYQMFATRSLQSWPLRLVLKGMVMDVTHHSDIGTQHTLIEVMNHIKVLFISTERSNYSLTQDDECVTATKIIHTW